MNSGAERTRLSREQLVEEARLFLRRCLEAMGLELDFSFGSDGENIQVRLFGRDSGLLLSNQARLLYALNHLLNQVYYRRSADGCSFYLDCRHYRGSRARELRLMAEKAAEQVSRSRRPLELNPMPASERREIHLALRDRPGIRTESRGTGVHRRVVVLPAP